MKAKTTRRVIMLKKFKGSGSIKKRKFKTVRVRICARCGMRLYAPQRYCENCIAHEVKGMYYLARPKLKGREKNFGYFAKNFQTILPKHNLSLPKFRVEKKW